MSIVYPYLYTGVDPVITANTQMVSNNSYVLKTNAGIIMSLPINCLFGDTIAICSISNAHSWVVPQGTGQLIRINGFTSLPGPGHQLTAPSSEFSCISLLCVVSSNLGNATWIVQNSQPAVILSAPTANAFGFN